MSAGGRPGRSRRGQAAFAAAAAAAALALAAGSTGGAAASPARVPVVGGGAVSAAVGPVVGGGAASGARATGVGGGAWLRAGGAPAGGAASAASVAATARPALRAPAAIVVERDLGVTVLARNADQERAIASTTKLMTAYVALHQAGVGRVLVVQPYAPAPGETVAGLRPGELLTVGDLLAAMLLPSGGDAAHTLAVDLAGSTDRFVGAMNAAAAALHLDETHYSTPVGLDTPGNYSTARDLAILAGAAAADPRLREDRRPAAGRSLTDGRTWSTATTSSAATPSSSGSRPVTPPPPATAWSARGRRDGATVISVVLGDPTRPTATPTPSPCCATASRSTTASEAVRRGRVYARVPVAGRPARAAVARRRSAPLAGSSCGGARRLTRVPGAWPRSREDRSPSRHAARRARVELDGQAASPGCPWSAAGPLAAPPVRPRSAVLLARESIGGLLLLVVCSLHVMLMRRAER